MSLPKIDQPIYTIKIPSTKKPVKFRPFLVKEEKLLLMAKESADMADILMTTKQVVNNCSVEKGFNINSIAIFDLEYIFLKLRALSVDNISKLSYVDNEDGETYRFEVDLNKIEITFPDKIDNNIKLSEKSGILMKYPPAVLYDDKTFLEINKNFMFELIVRCVDKLYIEDKVYEFKNYKKEEIEEFLNNLSIKTYEDIQAFLLNIPKLSHTLTYINKMGKEHKIELSSLNDFFM